MESVKCPAGAIGLLASMGSFIPGRRLVTYRPQAYASPSAQPAATTADAAVSLCKGSTPLQPCLPGYEPVKVSNMD